MLTWNLRSQGFQVTFLFDCKTSHNKCQKPESRFMLIFYGRVIYRYRLSIWYNPLFHTETRKTDRRFGADRIYYFIKLGTDKNMRIQDNI